MQARKETHPYAAVETTRLTTKLQNLLVLMTLLSTQGPLPVPWASGAPGRVLMMMVDIKAAAVLTNDMILRGVSAGNERHFGGDVQEGPLVPVGDGELPADKNRYTSTETRAAHGDTAGQSSSAVEPLGGE